MTYEWPLRTSDIAYQPWLDIQDHCEKPSPTEIIADSHANVTFLIGPLMAARYPSMRTPCELAG